MVPYTYCTLPPESGSVRLLRLIASPRKEASIQCELFGYTLSAGGHSHLYEALSYVWGSPEDGATITVDGAELSITRNLHSALVRLRDPMFDRILWVDAVSIDQKNLQERAQQVRLMPQIYHKASRVVVWLGEEYNESHHAMSALRRIANVGAVAYAPDDTEFKIDHLYQGVDALTGFFQRPWFGRVWILQEAAAAQHMAMICGDEEISGLSFIRAVHALESPGVRLREKMAPIASLIEQTPWHTTHLTEHSQLDLLNCKTILQLVDMFRTHEATDPRDKVYALVGMSTYTPYLHRVLPDYTRPWEDLFREIIDMSFTKQAHAKLESVEDFIAVICIKLCFLGIITCSSYTGGNQTITVTANTFLSKTDIATWQVTWSVQKPAIPIQEGDILCYVPGASELSIVRARLDYFYIIAMAIPPPLGAVIDYTSPRTHYSFPRRWRELLEHITVNERFLSYLVWDWSTNHEHSPQSCIKDLSLHREELSSTFQERLLNMTKMSQVLQLEQQFRNNCLQLEKSTSDDHEEYLQIISSFREKDLQRYQNLKNSILRTMYDPDERFPTELLETLHKHVGNCGPDYLELGDLLRSNIGWVKNVLITSIMQDINFDKPTFAPELGFLYELLRTDLPVEPVAKFIISSWIEDDPFYSRGSTLEDTLNFAVEHDAWGCEFLSSVFAALREDISFVSKLWELTMQYQKDERHPKAIESFITRNRVDIEHLYDDPKDCGEMTLHCIGPQGRLSTLFFIWEQFQPPGLVPWLGLARMFEEETDSQDFTARVLVNEALQPYLWEEERAQRLLWSAIEWHKLDLCTALLETCKIDLNWRQSNRSLYDHAIECDIPGDFVKRLEDYSE